MADSESKDAALAHLHVPGAFVDGGAEVLEVALDSLLTDGFLKELPVLGSAVALIRTVGSVRDQIYARKIARFVKALDGTSSEERQRFAEELDREPDGRARAGENVLLLLEQLDDMRKAEIAGKFYAAYVRGTIDLRLTRLLCNALMRFELEFADALRSWINYRATQNIRIERIALEHFVACGFAYNERETAGQTPYVHPTDLARAFVSYGL